MTALRRRLLRPVAGGAALLATGLLVSCGSSHPHAAVPVSATTQPSLAPPTTQAPRGPYVWTRATSPALAIGGGASTTISAAEAPGGGRPWLVAGTRISTGGATTATVWRSLDGATWQAEPLTGAGIESEADAATPFEGGTVVVGSVGPEPQEVAEVWISSHPGGPFAPVAASELPPGASTLTAVASGGLGLFATGETTGGVVVWYSNNGTRWTRLGAAERVINGASDPHINSLLVAADGVYAAGWERDGNRIDAAIWTSGDGIHWHPVLTAPSAFAGGGDRVITALVAVGTASVPTGFVAVGGMRLGSEWQPASWISPNGASWSEPSHAFAMGVRPQGTGTDAIVRSMSIATNGPESATLVAVGGSNTAQRVWHSADGVHWSELALPAGAARSPGWTASLVASNGPALIVASGVAGEPHVLVNPGRGWIEPSAQPSVFGPIMASAQPVGAARGPAGLVLAVHIVRPAQSLIRAVAAEASLEFLASRNGAAWRAQPAGAAFAGASVEGLTAFGGRFVAVGTRTVAGQPRAAAWMSTNGITWNAGSVLDQSTPAGRAVPGSIAYGVCARGAVVVAVGAATTHGVTVARAWISRDGVHWDTARVAGVSRPAGSYRMAGCAAVGSTFEAYGTARLAGPAGTAGPLVASAWIGGTSGAAWAAQGNDAYGDLPGPLLDLAGSARSWLALVAADPVPPDGEASPITLYASADNGASWQTLDTTADPWTGAGPPQLDEVAWSATTPVVVGQVDGQLAIWTGLPSS